MLLTLIIKKVTVSVARYGAKLTGEGTENPADILISFFNVLIGAWGLGLCAPQWKIMTVGRGAACKVYATIDRVS